MTLFAGTQYEIKCRPTFWVLCNKFRSLEMLLQIFLYRPATLIHGLNRASLNLITTTLTQSTSAHPAATNLVSEYMILPSPRRRSTERQPNKPYTQTMSLDMTAPPTTNTLEQSVSHRKPHPSTRTTFLHYLYFPEKSLYANRERGRSYQYAIRFTLWLSFSECPEGRSLGGSPMEGIFVEMERGGDGDLTHGKR